MNEIIASKSEFVVRLARDPDEITAAQRLRYRVFYEEMGAIADAQTAAQRLDSDEFDDHCDHLLVVRQSVLERSEFRVDGGELVGTYRLLRQDIARQSTGFYSARAFEIEPLLSRKSGLSFLELGRSCVNASFRDRPAVELLWQGIWNYVRHYQVDVMLGCASLEGTDPDLHANALTFLANAASAPDEWTARAMPDKYVDMRRQPAETVDAKAALRSLPPLVKAYLRLGCYIGDGAVIDRQFNTTDVLVILPVLAINPKYFAHFGGPQQLTN